MSPSRLSSTAASLLTGFAALASAASDSCSNNDLSVSYDAPVAADGWSYRLVANGFTAPRGIAFDSDGGLLIVDSGVGLIHQALKDDGGTCIGAGEKKTLIENEELNHGLALSQDGKTLYASSSDKVWSWSYDSKKISVGDTNRTIVTNMSNSDHTTRTLLLSKKHPDTLLVSRGSDSNTDEDAKDKGSGHSQIRAFDLASNGSATDDGAYDFLDGTVLGWGLRNSVGVAENPADGGIWSVENSVDELHRDGKDIHQNNPAEELNFHGYLNGSDAHQGGNYGYPVCYAIWSTKGFPKVGDLQVGDQFPSGMAPDDLTDEACNTDYVDPRLAFQAHTAPLDILFDESGDTAYISFHGSWDRSDPVGYRIASVAFSPDTAQPSAKDTSNDAAIDILTNKDLSKCPDECFRPVGLAWDSQGRLWFSSDDTGEIFVLEHKGKGGGGGGSGDGGDGDSGAQMASSGRVGWVVTAAAVAIGLLMA